MNTYAKWFGRVVWLGIIINVVFFVIPLLFFPEVMLSLLKMQIPVPIIWVRAAGLLLLEISILYIPGAMDPYRYKATAWMSILVTRGGGATFFITAVLLFGQDLGFLSIALVDLVFAVIQGILLFLALQTQQPFILETAKGLS
ncbi:MULTISPECIES: hypothetical protein [Moorena]|uniref:Uncharacterized protein n=1 Tax=Moorena producens (strain JHB) TaxID=1454205 RepID=A0A1D9G5P8_MOOP1|nr:MULTISPECIES: hypothetical protein [Moorena]NES80836.1 hypothetical protein [Moorena sp. SIO2B7]AOY82903.1 hypothetical protein BJP36_26325 [Moorena producens JHB]NEP34150.1 hypothetical protein [Moorena sp. SIO3B2]NER85993.1 hypothetical protein [Moorena sp. SIO3A2]NES40088.1 hypothetical protein [Moorena sp. SIO2C4]